MPHERDAAAGWVRLYDDPGVPVDVAAALGSFGVLDGYATVATQIIVGEDAEGLDELVGLMMHPELEGVALGPIHDTPAGRLPVEELTAVLRELGWRYATEDEVRELHTGYSVPGLSGAPRPMDGGARASALADLT